MKEHKRRVSKTHQSQQELTVIKGRQQSKKVKGMTYVSRSQQGSTIVNKSQEEVIRAEEGTQTTMISYCEEGSGADRESNKVNYGQLWSAIVNEGQRWSTQDGGIRKSRRVRDMKSQ